MGEADREVPLTGGNTPGVVRVGDTVRRPLNPNSGWVHRLLIHFEGSGFDGVPRFLGIDDRNREILSFIEGFAPPHNGFKLTEEGVRAGARLLRRVHDLTEGTEFAAGSEVACHPNLSQPNFIFRDRDDMVPVAIIDWDNTRPGRRLDNVAQFLWAYVHPGMYEEGDPPARMLRVAVDAYGWTDAALVDAMLAEVRHFVAFVAPGPWGRGELAHLERHADLFREWLR